MKQEITRRGFLAATATATIARLNADANDEILGFKLGVASYSFRSFPRAEAIKMMQELKIKYASIKEFHLKYTDSPEELEKGRKEFEAAGIKIMSGGNISLAKNDDADIRKYFQYAKNCGMMPKSMLIPIVLVLCVIGAYALGNSMIASTTRLNTPGIQLAQLDGVHAITDVTGFGLAGHTLELARGAGLTAVIDWPAVPLLDGVSAMAADGFITGASGRNWAGYGAQVSLDPALPPVAQALLTDPQTSGGLLVSCTPDSVDAVLAVFRSQGFEQAAVIGEVRDGPARLQVRA